MTEAKKPVAKVPMPMSTMVPEKPMRGYEVTCIRADSLETAVQLVEDGKLHSCLRRVYFYEFELKPLEESHPRISLLMATLTPGLYEHKKQYILSMQEK